MDRNRRIVCVAAAFLLLSMVCTQALYSQYYDTVDSLEIRADPDAWPDIQTKLSVIQSDVMVLYGFSRDARIAYMYYLARTECYNCSELYIVDLRNNAVVKSYFFSSETERTPGAIRTILKDHAIEPSESDHFETWHNHVYITSETTEKHKLGSVRRFWYSDPRAAKAIGFVKSPFEERGLLIVAFPAIYPGDSYIGGIALQGFGVRLKP